MKKKFCKLSAIFIGLIMMFTVVVLPNVEAALPVDVNKKCSLEISISSHSYAKDLSKMMFRWIFIRLLLLAKVAIIQV